MKSMKITQITVYTLYINKSVGMGDIDILAYNYCKERYHDYWINCICINKCLKCAISIIDKEDNVINRLNQLIVHS